MPYKSLAEKRQYQKEWIAARRRQWMAMAGPCCKCGSWKLLQVDHIDSDKKVAHKVWSWSERRMLAELSKCQVLCLECHQEKTAIDQAKRIKHGTYTAYRTYECRCWECCGANRARRAPTKSRPGTWTVKVGEPVDFVQVVVEKYKAKREAAKEPKILSVTIPDNFTVVGRIFKVGDSFAIGLDPAE